MKEKSGFGVDQERSTTRTEAPASDPLLREAFAIVEALLDQQAMPDEELDKRVAALRAQIGSR